MAEPAAMDIARCVIRCAKHCGAPLREYAVSLTDVQAAELMDWFLDQADPRFVDREALRLAIVEAKAHDNPWEVLQHFSLLGMAIERRTRL